ncbi:MAG: T9SS type A sorting domain-containing protein [Bacteroidia bacterium]
MIKSITISVILIFSIFCTSSAQDILGGEIRYSQSIVDPNTYQIEVFLYTRTSLGIPHNGTATNLPNDITEWHLSTSHTYPGPGNYNIIETDSFRIAGIDNIINSANEKIMLRAHLEINPFINGNTSAVFNYKQTELYTDGINIYNDASAIDPNGDSLYYTLVATTTNNYYLPPGASIDAVTGLFQMPLSNNTYAINIEVKEYRNGTLVGTTYREMIIDSASITSIPELNINDNLMIYPNPATDIINIISKNEIDEINLYELTGKVILSQKTLPEEKLNLKNIDTGIYLLEIIYKNGNKVWRRVAKN